MACRWRRARRRPTIRAPAICTSGTFAPGAYPFKGLLDEVRVYTRTLAAADVNALYLGSGPVLALPFDEAWAANGTLLPDDSGWQRQATLTHRHRETRRTRRWPARSGRMPCTSTGQTTT